MSTASLGDAVVTKATVTLPRWGVWSARVRTDRDAGLVRNAPATLVLADLTLVGHVVIGGPHVGAGHYLLAGGVFGWSRKVRSRGYRNDAGVKLSLVVADLARDAGELITAGFEDRRVGAAWTRAEAIAAQGLEAISPRAWYTGEDGRTRIGRRAASALIIPTELVLEPAPDRSSVVVALDEIAALVPETVVTDVGTIASVEHTLTDRTLRSRLYLDGAS